MPLFFIIHRIEGKERIWLQEASYGIFARMKAALAGLKGDYVAIGDVDDKTARKVPKKMIGRLLSQDEAGELLKRMG